MTIRRALTLTLIVAALATLAGCTRTFSASTSTPAWTPLPATFAFPTVSPATPSATTSPDVTVAPTGVLSTISPGQTQVVTCPATGSMGVVLVTPDEVLNIRSGPGVENDIEGIYSSNETDIALSGASEIVDGSRWVQVCVEGEPVGWVNATYLTEVLPSGQFCGDARVTSLLDKMQTAFANRDGQAFASLVSPAHGVYVWLWNSGLPVNFDAAHAGFAFESDFVNDWGTHPASGIETSGTFHELVLPELQDTFVASAQRRCNDGEISSYGETWPAEYANINFYQVVRPGTPGVELDWNVFLVGVEYVNGQPYLFSLIHFIWTQ